MNYIIKERSYKNLILTLEEKELASLNYKGWNAATSEIILNNGEKFNIESESLWRSSFELKQNKKVLLHFHMNLGGTLVIKSTVSDHAIDFTMKSKGFWGKSYVLLDKNGNQLAEITPNYSWKTFKNQYAIQTAPVFDAAALHDVLLLIMAYYVRYYIAMVSAVV